MRYSLILNQKLWQNNFPDVDILGVCIFEILKSCCAISNHRLKKMTWDNEEYTWINYDLIIEDLPIFNIKSKSVIFRRLEQLRKYKIIKTRIIQDDLGHHQFYVKITEEALKLEDENPILLEEQGLLGKINMNESAFSRKNGDPISLEESTSNTNTITNKYIDEIDESKAILISNKLVEIYEENIGEIKSKLKIASKFKELLKSFKAKELEEIIIKKGKDSWFMKNVASKGPTWFLSNKTRLERYLDEEQK